MIYYSFPKNREIKKRKLSWEFEYIIRYSVSNRVREVDNWKGRIVSISGRNISPRIGGPYWYFKYSEDWEYSKYPFLISALRETMIRIDHIRNQKK